MSFDLSKLVHFFRREPARNFSPQARQKYACQDPLTMKYILRVSLESPSLQNDPVTKPSITFHICATCNVHIVACQVVGASRNISTNSKSLCLDYMIYNRNTYIFRMVQ